MDDGRWRVGYNLMEMKMKLHWRLWFLLIGLMGFLLACEVTFVSGTPSAAPVASGPSVPATAAIPAAPWDTPAMTPQSYADWLQIYFTNPSAPTAKNYKGGPDQALAKAIDAAKLSVDVAAYSFNLWSLRDALVHAKQRGVTVRMVMESDNMDDPEVQDLKNAGIPVLGDQQEGLMHDKFMVIDRAQVWTGSMNYTAGGAYNDNNDLLCIHSTQAAEDYTHEFEGMFIEKRFGSARNSQPPYPSLSLSGTPVEIFFSPRGQVASRIVQLINSAQTSIQFLAYSFTSNDIGNAIIAKARDGLNVSGVVDHSQATQQGNEYDPFKQAGLDVHLDGNGKGLMHHKLIIIDHHIVITGSYNFTTSAEKTNDENLIIIDNADVAAQYMEEFTKVYGEAQP